MTLKVSVVGKTDKGLVRPGNEDSFYIDSKKNLFLVCDGMGGHQAGEVASNEACNVISHCFDNLADEISNNSELKLPAVFPFYGDLLIKSIRIANRSIFLKAGKDVKMAGMGTTIVAVVFEDDMIGIAHVGDSRVYRLTNTELIRLTTDHSWVSELQVAGHVKEAEAADMVARNVITRALGVNGNVEVDFRSDQVKPGEMYILCSDGLCGFADDDEIFEVAKNCDFEINTVTNNLIQLANDHGGQDNVTVVTIRVDEVSSNQEKKTVGPVTILKENEETLSRQDGIIEQITTLRRDLKESEEEAVHQGRKGVNLPLILIFIGFAIVAAITIYFSLKN